MPSLPDHRRRPVYAQAFGIRIALHDDLGLAGLARADETRDDDQTTAVRHDSTGVRGNWSGARPTRTREVYEDGRLLLSVDHDAHRGYLLSAPGIGVALISPDGLEVRCAPQLDASDWEALLVGQVLPLVATLRGLEVFHAAGVVQGDRAHLLCAPQGVGKTSLAAHLVISGAELLSDDVVAVDPRLIAQSGSAVLNVRDRELQRMAPESLPGLRRLGTVHGRVRFAAEHPAHSQPLGAIYLLERDTDGPAVESVPHPSPFSLLAATFNLSVRSPERLARHLELCARLAEQIPVFRVRIVPGRSPADLAAALAPHIGDRQTMLV